MRAPALGASRGHLALIVALLLTACGGGDHVTLYDAGPRPDGPPGSDGAVGVNCNGNMCFEGYACCREIVDRPPPTYFCIPDPDACFGAYLLCDGPEDCADGEICCSDGDGVHCSLAEDCTGIMLCHTNEGCGGLVCCPTSTPFINACLLTCE